MVIHGSPKRVLDQLAALVDEVGTFGTLLLTHQGVGHSPRCTSARWRSWPSR